MRTNRSIGVRGTSIRTESRELKHAEIQRRSNPLKISARYLEMPYPMPRILMIQEPGLGLI
jgi:hypothetical protein